MKRVGVEEKLDTYLRLLKVIEDKIPDRQTAAIVFAELASDIRAGLVWQAPAWVDWLKAKEEEAETVVKLSPRIP